MKRATQSTKNTMAGKGPQLRKGANLQKYWDHYDDIFRKSKKVASQLDCDDRTRCSAPYKPNDCESSTGKADKCSLLITRTV